MVRNAYMAVYTARSGQKQPAELSSRRVQLFKIPIATGNGILEEGKVGRGEGECDEKHTEKANCGKSQPWAAVLRPSGIEQSILRVINRSRGYIENGDIHPVRRFAQYPVERVEQYRDQDKPQHRPQ